MNKTQSTIFTACLIGSACVIALSSGIITSTILFLFVGKIPGTNAYLTPVQMVVVLVILASITAYLNLAAHHKIAVRKQYATWKNRLPKHRFTQA